MGAVGTHEMKQRAKRQAAMRNSARSRFLDGIFNPLLRLGQGTRNTFNATGYVPKFQTIQRQPLEWAYQGSWMCGLAVDIVAEDMTREGIDIKCDDPEIIDALNVLLDDSRVWDGLCDAIKWSRLYGGAIAVMLIDGDDMSQPLEHVRPDTFRGIITFDRWQIKPSSEVVQKLGPNFGKPLYYTILSGMSEVATEISGTRVHYSRVIRFEGRRLPYNLRTAYQGWGASILEPIFDRVEMFDLASQGAAQLLSKAYLRFYKVKGLREILTNDLARDGFLKQMDIVREFQGIEGMTVGDIEDDFQTMQYTFTGIPEIMLQFGQQISGAIGVPLVRLFGQSPVGFNSTGESDLRIYYDNVKHDQDTDLRPGLKRLLNVMYKSVTGKTPGKDFSFEFRSLWQMTNEQKAQAAQTMTASIISALQADAIPISVAMKELRKLSDTVGIFASITDEDIDAAEESDNGLMPPDVSLGGSGFGGQQEAGSEVVPRADENGTDRKVVPQTPAANQQAGGFDRAAF